MVEKTIVTRYAEYGSITELETCDRELCEAAIAALSGSYAPYSNFNVGAAVRLADGNIVIGSNQENAASPSGLCAERTAMFAANATHPGVPMRSIAIVGSQNGSICDGITSPCGACRQVMAEYQHIAGENLSVLLVSSSKILKFSRVDDILPFIFDNLYKYFCQFAEKNYICVGKVVHDQLPLNSPRAGRQQGQEVVAVRCTKLSLFFNGLLKRTTSRSAFYCRSDPIHFRLDILS